MECDVMGWKGMVCNIQYKAVPKAQVSPVPTPSYSYSWFPSLPQYRACSLMLVYSQQTQCYLYFHVCFF